MKLCQDCRYIQTDDYCGHPSAMILDYVHGNHKMYPCSTERQYDTRIGCAAEGRNFEPKESIDG